MERLRIVRHGGEKEIVGLGHRATDLVRQRIADRPFVEVFPGHRFSP